VEKIAATSWAIATIAAFAGTLVRRTSRAAWPAFVGPEDWQRANRSAYYRVPLSFSHITRGERIMAESVYKVIELVGTSTESWEKAAAAAIALASKSLRDLRVAEVSTLDMTIKNGKVESYRAKLKVSFKYEGKA
jgi:flavin-binding protein dodecin